jgi:hypothetical protein
MNILFNPGTLDALAVGTVQVVLRGKRRRDALGLVLRRPGDCATAARFHVAVVVVCVRLVGGTGAARHDPVAICDGMSPLDRRTHSRLCHLTSR